MGASFVFLSDSAFASRVYKEVAAEAGLEIGEDGLVVLPENFRESEDLKNLATRQAEDKAEAKAWFNG